MDPVTKFVLLGGFLAISHFLWNYIRSPLKAFPGPIVARFTNLWRVYDIWKGRADITHNSLHRTHGPAVRLGPNMISLSDPALISRVYPTRGPWKKTNLYSVSDVIIGGMRTLNLFSAQDENWHAKYARPPKGIYTMTRVLELEPGVDMTIRLFLDKMRERFVSPGQPCEMSDYVNFFAWDAMSQLTLSNHLGLLEAGWDYAKILETARKGMGYFSKVGPMSYLDKCLDKNPVCRIGPPSFGWVAELSMKECQKRIHEGKPAQHEYLDFLDRYLETKTKNPNVVDDNVVLMYLMSNIGAGSDTTAVIMRAAVYHVLKQRSVHESLRDELRSANLSTPAQWKEIRSLPYLEAVMREAMRLNPGIALPLERVVPKGGFTLPDERFIPEDTIVGMNPWVVNRDTKVFGAEPDSFIPERWLPYKGESDDVFQSRVSKMKGAEFTFGAGPRMCMGKHVSLLESYKFIATLFTTFDMELSNPDSDWKVTNSWFVWQENFPVVVRERSA